MAVQYVRTPFEVSVWMAIGSLWPCFTAKIGFKVGNGRSIAIWIDDWAGNGPLMNLFSDLFPLAVNKTSSLPDYRINGVLEHKLQKEF